MPPRQRPPDRNQLGQRPAGQRPPSWIEISLGQRFPILDREPPGQRTPGQRLPGQRPPILDRKPSWTETPLKRLSGSISNSDTM